MITTAGYIDSMFYPAMVTIAVYIAVMIGDQTGLKPHERNDDTIASVALSASVLINMAGIGLVPFGIYWFFVPPIDKLPFGNRYILPMRIMYLATGTAAFILLWLDPFGVVSRYQV